MSDCLTKLAIQKFLNDALDDHDRQQAVDHIETCEACQRAIEHALEHQTAFLRSSDSTLIIDSSGPASRFSKLSDAIRQSSVVEPSQHEQIPPGHLPQIDCFKLIAEVGRGASGVVYEAVQRDLDRKVAIKLITGQLFNQSNLKERFLREAKSVAALNHPNIAQLYQISDSPTYGPYLVFEFVDADPLDRLIQGDGAMPPKQAIEICRAVAAATQHAHDHHLVHRDLKPSNILVDRKSQMAKVIDFGLAVDPDEQSRLTMDSFIAGTPAYMSPEQIQSPRDVDHHSDIYSLGVVLYEMLTGGVPFRGISKKTLSRVINEIPQRLTTINPDVPKDLETICLKALNKLPHQRYSAMRELDEDLQRWQQGRNILAKPATRFTTAYRWAQRNPLSATLGAIAATLLLLVTAGSVAGVLMLSNANQQTQAAKEKSDLAASIAINQRDQLLDTIDSLVYDVNDEVETQYLSEDKIQVRLLQIALDGLSETGDEYDADVAQRIGDINLRLATVYSQIEKYELAEEHLNQALVIANDLVDANENSSDALRLQSFTFWEQANLYALQGQIQRAVLLSNEAEACDEKLLVADLSEHDKLNYLVHKGYARLNLGIGLQNKLADSNAAIHQFNAGIEHAQKLPGKARDTMSGELDSIKYHSLCLIQYISEGLADCYWENEKTDLAAAHDSVAKRTLDQLSIYDDGRQNSEMAAAIPTDSITNAIDPHRAESNAIQMSKQFYDLILEDSGESKDASTLLIDVDYHYRLGNLFLETKKYVMAIAQFRRSQKITRQIEPDQDVANFDILVAEADAQLHLIEAIEAQRNDTSDAVAKLKKMISELESSERDDELNIRTINRIKYEAAQLEP